MRDNFESNGIWFLPNAESDEISGKVSYSQDQGIFLDLIGRFGDSKSKFSEPDCYIILGVLQNGKKVTLVNTSVTQSRYSFPGFPTVKYICMYMFIGGHFYNKEDLKFNEIAIEYHNLYEWMSITGIKTRKLSDTEFILNYSIPSNIRFKVKEYFASFEYSSNAKSDNSNAFSLIENIEFQLTKSTEVYFHDILTDALIFQGLLTFCTFENCYPNSIKLKNNNLFEIYNEHKLYNEIELYFKSQVSGRKKPNRSSTFLLSYQDVKQNFQNIVDSWYRYNSEIEPIIYLFLNSFSNNNSVYNESKFLEIAHALETLHRRIFKNKVFGESEYCEMKRVILDSIPIHHRSWLQGKLNYGNEPTLHDRLSELLSEISEFYIINQMIDNRDKFIKDTKNSRNYYTHYDIKLEKKALKGAPLILLTRKLRIILIVHLLILLGIDKEKINEILDDLKNYHFNYLFKDED